MKTICIYSGGMDSTVLLYYLRHHGYQVTALSINYGQRHKRELEAARVICQKLKLEHYTTDISAAAHLLSGSSQTDPRVPVPHGHYEEESMKKTVVPNRNMILLALAGGLAVSQRADFIAYGAHHGDHAIYPDCRPAFALAMDAAFKLCDWHPPKLLRPFLDKSKAMIATLGHDLHVPFELTYSCYEGGPVHCGKCGTCTERREAFASAKLNDPTQYQ